MSRHVQGVKSLGKAILLGKIKYLILYVTSACNAKCRMCFNWDGMRERYQPLLADLAHRADLDYILAELVAELNVGHTYINSSPEMPRPDRVDVAVLGAELEADGRYYRISKIFRGENWHD